MRIVFDDSHIEARTIPDHMVLNVLHCDGEKLEAIVVERYLLKPEESSRKRFTLAHEAAHKVMERHVPMQNACFHSEYDAEANYSEEDFHRIFSLNENLTNRLGAAIIMPGFLVAKALKYYNNSQKLRCYQGMVLAPDDKVNAQKMADSLGVSYSAFLNRLAYS